jgi:hypothetical protein
MARKKVDPSHLAEAIMYSEQLVDTGAWIAKADELLAAAGILERDIIEYWSAISIENRQVLGIPNRKLVQGPYFLLIAYALENYFKALLIHRNRTSLQNKLLSALPDYLKKHDLIELARDVNIAIDVTEEELLLRLSRNSIWSARYPVPTDPDALAAMKRLRKFSDGKYYLTAYLGPNDMSRVRGFVDRLRRIVINEIGDLHDK